MKGKKKLIAGVLALLAGVALTVPSYLGDFVAREAGKYLSEHWGLGVRIQQVKGNPFRGYTFYDTSLTGAEGELLRAQRLYLRPGLLKTLFGSLSLKWVELEEVVTTFDDLHYLASRISGQDYPPLPDFLPEGPIALKSLGGTLDGSKARGTVEVDVAGFPVKGEAQATLGTHTAFQKAHFELAGGVVDFKGDITPQLDLNLSAQGLDLTTLGLIVPSLQGSVAGRAFLEAHLYGSLDKPAATGKVQLDQGLLGGLPLSLAAPLAWSGDVMQLSPFELKLAGAPLSGGARLTFGPQTQLTLVTSLQEPLSADQIGQHVPQLGKGLKGSIDQFVLKVQGPFSELDGALRFKAPLLSYEQAEVRDLNLGADLKDGLLTAAGQGIALGAPLTLSGQGRLQSGGELSLNVQLKDLDLAKLKAFGPVDLSGRATATASVHGPLTALHTDARLVGQNLKAWGVALGSVNVPLWYESGLLKLKGQVGLGGGALDLVGAIDLAKSMANLQAHGTVGLAAFESFLSGLDGALGLKATLSGPLTDLKGAAQVTEGWAQAFGLKAVDLKGSSAFGLSPVNFDATLTARQLVTPLGLGSQGTVKLGYKDETFTLSDLQALFGGAPLSGALTLRGGALKGNFQLGKADLAQFSQAVMPGLFKGKASATVLLGGTTAQPELDAELQGESLAVGPLVAPSLTLKAKGPLNHVDFGGTTLAFPQGSLSAQGWFDLSSLAQGKLSFALASTDLATALPSLGLPLTGNLEGAFDLTSTQGLLSGTGRLASKAIKVAFLNLSHLSSTVNYKDKTLSLPDLRASGYGGSLVAPLVLNFEKNRWALNGQGNGVGLQALWADVMPQASGGLTGDLSLETTGGGELSPFSMALKGTLNSSGGELWGYDWVKLVTALHGEKNLRYSSAHLPFHLTHQQVTLLDGAEVLAHQGDGLYRFIKAKGDVNFSGPLSLGLTAQVNAKLAEMLLGGVGGALKGLGAGALLGGGKEALVGGVLAGALGGAVTHSGDSFRTLHFHLGGSFDQPKVGDFSLDPKEKAPSQADAGLTEKIVNAVNSDPSSPSSLKDTAQKALEEGLGDLVKDAIFKPAESDEENPLNEALQEGLKNLFKP